MIVLFINCKLFPFVSWILSGLKLYETRNRNTLKSLINKPLYIAETHKGKRPVIRCILTIGDPIIIDNLTEYNQYRKQACIKQKSAYDFIPGKKKVLYPLYNVQAIAPFVPCKGKRHGMTWMEYNGKEK